MADVFGFRENFGTGGDLDQIGKYRPDPGEIIVEVYDKPGNMVFMDSFNAGIDAPRHSCYVGPNIKEEPYDKENGFCATVHVDSFAKCSLEWECPIDAVLPFDVPTYIVSKPKAHHMKLWWGSKRKN
jgi:hypothetical protein